MLLVVFCLGERQVSSYPISRNALASGSPQKPWASAHRLMAAGEYELAMNAFNRAALEHGMTLKDASAYNIHAGNELYGLLCSAGQAPVDRWL